MVPQPLWRRQAASWAGGGTRSPYLAHILTLEKQGGEGGLQAGSSLGQGPGVGGAGDSLPSILEDARVLGRKEGEGFWLKCGLESVIPCGVHGLACCLLMSLLLG